MIFIKRADSCVSYYNSRIFPSHIEERILGELKTRQSTQHSADSNKNIVLYLRLHAITVIVTPIYLSKCICTKSKWRRVCSRARFREIWLAAGLVEFLLCVSNDKIKSALLEKPRRWQGRSEISERGLSEGCFSADRMGRIEGGRDRLCEERMESAKKGINTTNSPEHVWAVISDSDKTDNRAEGERKRRGRAPKTSDSLKPVFLHLPPSLPPTRALSRPLSG